MMDNKMSKGIKEIYIKAVLMGTALILLVAALIFFTTAWYTKMVSTAGMNLHAAQWDFTANHTVDAVYVNVYEYATLSNRDYAAPGTQGWIPITLGARQSDTDVEFILMVDRSTMSQEFRDRITFYFLDTNGKKVYFEADATDPSKPGTEKKHMTGIIENGTTQEVKIYWEWIYEAPETITDQALRLAWDEFDTKVGENPELYMGDMTATVTIVGVEVNPGEPVATTGN